MAGLVACGLGVSLAVATVHPAGAVPPDDAAPVGAPPAGEPEVAPSDDLPNPLADKRRELREEAITQVLTGEAPPTRVSAAHGPRSC
jgi:immune inhibitor A